MGIGYSHLGLQKVILPRETKSILITVINAKNGSLSEDWDSNIAGNLAQRIKLYLAGENVGFPDQLDFGKATKFQRDVWNVTRQISYGETKSYGWVAAKMGCPRGARAVGQALGGNPVPIVIPCHRVIGISGNLVGFAGGLSLKEFFLNVEFKNRVQ